MDMKKRLLGIFLGMVMVMSLVPASIFADETGTSTCICETSCISQSMNSDCPVCGAEGALPENCGKYIAENGAPAENAELDKNAYATALTGDTHSHCVCGGSVTTGDHEHDTTAHTWTAWDGTGDITYTDNVAYLYLTNNATLSSVLTVTDGNTLNLCLNGNTLSRTYTVIEVEGNATLNICDCAGGGEITSTSGCAISVTTKNNSNVHTTFNLYGGKIVSESTFDSGTIKLYNNDGENSQTVAVFNMYGGEVCNGSSGQSAVYASYANIGTGYYKINMYGGNITCENGNGFHFNNNKNVAMQVAGGTITTGWYGIWLSSQNTLTLSGNPKFVDKAYFSGTANIYIPSNVTPTVTGDFVPADNTIISVDKSVDSSGSVLIAKPAESENSLSEKTQYFVSSEEGYFVECNTDGNLQLTACAIEEQPSADNSYKVSAKGDNTDKTI